MGTQARIHTPTTSYSRTGGGTPGEVVPFLLKLVEKAKDRKDKTDSSFKHELKLLMSDAASGRGMEKDPAGMIRPEYHYEIGSMGGVHIKGPGDDEYRHWTKTQYENDIRQAPRTPDRFRKR